MDRKSNQTTKRSPQKRKRTAPGVNLKSQDQGMKMEENKERRGKERTRRKVKDPKRRRRK